MTERIIPTKETEIVEGLVKSGKLSDFIKTDATIDMNSIVAFFISKYEKTLLENKKTLSDKINTINKYMETDFVSLIEKEMKFEKFKITNKFLGLKTKVEISLDNRSEGNYTIEKVFNFR